jgi:guanine deaminase
MAHCVWSNDAELALIKKNGVWVAHCPQSNENLASGIAPVRKMLRRGLHVGLGSDVAAGCHTSMFRAMADAVRMSKLYWRYVDKNDAPLTLPEAFSLATLGGGSFFGKCGSFDNGYEFDAVVIDDTSLAAPFALSIPDRLERAVYLSDEGNIAAKYVRGHKIKL